jgi:signal transduction histidine kinase
MRRNKLKNKKYFTAVKFLFYGILIINLMLIFISVNRSSMVVLIFSQITFILFICIAWLLIKRTFSDFFTNLFVMMDKMMNQEAVTTYDDIDDTYISQIYHQLNRLYDVLQMQQSSIEKEKSKVQSFVSDISHQLKTPLTNLHLLQEALKQPGILREEYRDCLEKQGKQLDKIDFLIRALLKTSQLENGLIQIQPRETSIGQTILSALEGILVPAEKKDIEVYYDNTTDYIVLHDPKWTSEALFNVMENAIKYTPQNGKLTILLNRTEKYIKISIRDTGIGIPPADLSNIFIRFWRGNTNISEGNGIGLYLCKQIITLQHGYILVNSTVNSGSEFEIFIPL